MQVVTKTEGPAAELYAELAAKRTAGELLVRIDLTRAEYDALIDDLERIFERDFRGQGPLAAFENVPIVVDGTPAAMLSSIQIPRRGPANQ